MPIYSFIKNKLFVYLRNSINDKRNNENNQFFMRFFLFTREIYSENNEYDLLLSLLNNFINENILNVSIQLFLFFKKNFLLISSNLFMS